MWGWMEDCLAGPRARHLNWTRHVYRELNEEANDLATKGKLMTDLGCNLQIDKKGIANMKFLRGTWDGGYDPGKLTCGVGFVLYGCRCRPVQNQTWATIAVGHGKCRGG